MSNYENKSVLVVGLGASGRAAMELLLRAGARVTAADSQDGAAARSVAGDPAFSGVTFHLGAAGLPPGSFDLAVLSPGVPLSLPLVVQIRAAAIPVISELELGFQESRCLHIAVTGTDGKTTTTRLIERMLLNSHKRTVAAGNIGTPLSAVAGQTRELDFVTLETSSYQLETIQYFRPIIAVVTNIAPDHLDRHGSMDAYVRAKGRIFENQQGFDWAIVQSGALAQFKAAGVPMPAKVVTFSATDPDADIHLDRSLLISRLPGWEGPLLDLDSCRLRGAHNAENCMAALAVGKVLRLPLEETLSAIRGFETLPHRCEPIASVRGIAYINDSKSTSLHSLNAALRSVAPAPGGRPNIWLIAGGKDKGLEYYDAGPLLSQRVRGTFLIGEMREKLRGAWSLFTPCSLCGSLLEAVHEAAGRAEPGDVVLLSPACSSFDQFQNYQHRGDVFRSAVAGLLRAVSAEPPEPSSKSADNQ